MKHIPKQVFVLVNNSWNETEFRLLKSNDVFTFDREQIFTASCDSYVVENDGTWSVLVTNKDLERFRNEKKQDRENKLLYILT